MQVLDALKPVNVLVVRTILVEILMKSWHRILVEIKIKSYKKSVHQPLNLNHRQALVSYKIFVNWMTDFYKLS